MITCLTVLKLIAFLPLYSVVMASKKRKITLPDSSAATRVTRGTSKTSSPAEKVASSPAASPLGAGNKVARTPKTQSAVKRKRVSIGSSTEIDDDLEPSTPRTPTGRKSHAPALPSPGVPPPPVDWWKVLISPTDTAALNSAAEDPVRFSKLARHFWARTFLFNRAWSVESQELVYKPVLDGINTKDRAQLKSILESTYYDTEESLCRTVKRFATLWLEETELGQQFAAEWDSFRYASVFFIRVSLSNASFNSAKKNARKYAEPAGPIVPPDLFRLDGRKGFVWNVAVSTRFWQDSLLSVQTNIPLNAGLSWLYLDDYSKETSWYKALNGIALELIRLAVHRLVQGKHRMSTDLHRAHFRSTCMLNGFINDVLNSPDLQRAVAGKSAKDILMIPGGETSIIIESQNCTTTWPHCTVETEAITRKLRATQQLETRLLEPNDTQITDMLQIVDSEIEITGGRMASDVSDRLEANFMDAVTGIQHYQPAASASSSVHNILNPSTERTADAQFTAQRLGTLYAESDIYGRCDIHRMVMNVEIARIEKMYETLLERKEWLTNEIADFDKKVIGSRRRYAQAQKIFEECDNLDVQALEQRDPAPQLPSMAAVAQPTPLHREYTRAGPYPDRQHRQPSNPSRTGSPFSAPSHDPVLLQRPTSNLRHSSMFVSTADPGPPSPIVSGTPLHGHLVPLQTVEPDPVGVRAGITGSPLQPAESVPVHFGSDISAYPDVYPALQESGPSTHAVRPRTRVDNRTPEEILEDEDEEDAFRSM